MLKISWHTLTLQDPYHYRGSSRNTKDSAFLSLNFNEKIFSSELSVFPGLHETNRGFYEAKLPSDLFKNLKLPVQMLKSSNEVREWAHQYYSPQLAPNILQALDTLLLEILGFNKKLPSSWQKFFDQPQWCCDSARLITQLHHSFELKNQEGTFKIKMGRVELEQDIKNLKKWMSQNPKAIVRLDANELWTGQDLETLLSRLTATELASIEYLEDPCPIRDWQKISFSNKPPLALEQTSPNTPSDIWVYRPSSTKGFLLGMCELEQHLQESAHVDVVLSSSFETELGLQWCIFMANALELKRAQGLGTLSHLGPERAPADHLQVDDKGARVCILRA